MLRVHHTKCQDGEAKGILFQVPTEITWLKIVKEHEAAFTVARVSTIEIFAPSCSQMSSNLSLIYNEREPDSEAAMVACSNQVLMQTATTTALNMSSDHSIPVRMILDLGSQRTYITHKLAENLKLKLSNPESVTVVTLGQRNQSR